MGCESINKILYLKSEELSRSEAKKLFNHLAVCTFCKKERNKFEAANEIITRLKRIEPVMDNPVFSEESIIESIQQINEDKPETVFNKLFNKLADFIEMPFIRYALVTLLAFIFISFFYEEATTVITISRLEENSAMQFNQEITAGGIFEDQTKIFNAIPELYKLFSGKKNFAKLSDDWMVMNKEELKSFLQLSSKLNGIKSNLPFNFKLQYPLLAKYINLELNDKQVEEFINQKDEILIELKKFLKEEEVKNEIKK